MMSPREAVAIVRRVTVRNPPFPIRIEATESERDGIEVRIITMVPCRDTGVTISVMHTDHMFPFSEEQVIAFVSGFIRTVFDHEWKECLHVDGVRVRDPHKHEAAR